MSITTLYGANTLQEAVLHTPLGEVTFYYPKGWSLTPIGSTNLAWAIVPDAEVGRTRIMVDVGLVRAGTPEEAITEYRSAMSRSLPPGTPVAAHAVLYNRGAFRVSIIFVANYPTGDIDAVLKEMAGSTRLDGAISPDAVQRPSTCSGGTYRSGKFSFDYPDGWCVTYQGQDPNPDYSRFFLVRIEQPGGEQRLEIRYCDSTCGYDVRLGQRMAHDFMRQFKAAFIGVEPVQADSPAGGVSSTYSANSLTNASLGTISALVLSGSVVVQVGAAHDLGLDPTRAVWKHALATLRLAGSTAQVGRSVFGTWHTQGADLTLNSDGTVEYLNWANSSIARRGTFEINGNTIRIKYSAPIAGSRTESYGFEGADLILSGVRYHR